MWVNEVNFYDQTPFSCIFWLFKNAPKIMARSSLIKKKCIFFIFLNHHSNLQEGLWHKIFKFAMQEIGAPMWVKIGGKKHYFGQKWGRKIARSQIFFLHPGHLWVPSKPTEYGVFPPATGAARGTFVFHYLSLPRNLTPPLEPEPGVG